MMIVWIFKYSTASAFSTASCQGRWQQWLSNISEHVALTVLTEKLRVKSAVQHMVSSLDDSLQVHGQGRHDGFQVLLQFCHTLSLHHCVIIAGKLLQKYNGKKMRHAVAPLNKHTSLPAHPTHEIKRKRRGERVHLCMHDASKYVCVSKSMYACMCMLQNWQKCTIKFRDLTWLVKYASLSYATLL